MRGDTWRRITVAGFGAAPPVWAAGGVAVFGNIAMQTAARMLVLRAVISISFPKQVEGSATAGPPARTGMRRGRTADRLLSPRGREPRERGPSISLRDGGIAVGPHAAEPNADATFFRASSMNETLRISTWFPWL
jgi:hypothetical protein